MRKHTIKIQCRERKNRGKKEKKKAKCRPRGPKKFHIKFQKKWRKKIGIPKKNSYEIPNSEGKNWNL